MSEKLKAPFPYFGGKSRVASLVWGRLGDVENYCEPFFGSGAALLLRPTAPRIETANDADCVAPETRILRSDLTWVRAGEVSVGDSLMAFDENNGPAREGFRAPTSYRRWRLATVLAVRRLVKPCYRLTFDDGTVVVASADHLWLGGSHCSSGKGGGRGWRWQRTEGLVCNRATQRSWLLKVAPVVERVETHDAGWLAGLYDGEGHLVSGAGWRLVLSQKQGKVFDRAAQLLQEHGYEVRVAMDPKGVGRIEIGGGMRQALRLLMELRPERLIENLASKVSSVSLYGREHQAVGLVQKEFLGEQEVVAIQTDTSTFVAEGLASHNCYVANFWRATSHSPDEVAAYADSPVNEVDLHARHRWLVLSDDAATFRRRMRTEPDYYDPKVAGWWCWGLCCWIGSGWCSTPETVEWEGRGSAVGKPRGVQCAPGQDARKPRIDGGEGQLGHGVHAKGEPLSKLRIDGDNPGSVGKGVNAKGPAEQLPKLASSDGVPSTPSLSQQLPLLRGSEAGTHGAGVNTSGGFSAQIPRMTNDVALLAGPRDGGRPQLADAFDIGRGVNSHGDLGTCAARRAWLVEWFGRLRDRLRLVRVCCGDWLRVCDSDSVTTRLGTTGIFFDPPYGEKAGRNDKLYATDSLTVAADVRRYCLERGADPRMRIVLAGYEGEGHEVLEAHGWTVEGWAAQGGYGNRSAKGKKNAKKERLWCSPHCLNGRTLFDDCA